MPGLNEGILEKGYWEPAKQVVEVPTVTRASRYVVDILRPAVLTKSNGKETQVRRTAYLDGLRGFAAFLVYIQHHTLWAHPLEQLKVFENTYGSDGLYHFAALPGIKLFFCGGHFAVVTFFIISGYVLSAKPLSLIQSGDYVRLGDNLASALFRRWIRLHIPVIVTTFLYMLFFQLVWRTAFPTPQGNLRDEIWNWYCEMKNFTFTFRTGGEPWLSYNFHAWSIPVEFKGSIVVYTTLLAFSRATRNARLWGYVVLFVYFVHIADGWFGAAFVAGMAYSDLDLLAADNNLPNIIKRAEPYKKPLAYFFFAVSLYLGGVPAQTQDVMELRRQPGWYYLSYLKPQAMWDYKWFFLLWASIFVMGAIPRIPLIKGFFEMRVNQYLGRISFALYLVHGPILWTLGDRIYSATGFTRESNVFTAPGWINALPMSKGGPLGLEPAFLIPQLVLVPLTLWFAEVITKLVDEPSVKVTQWLYQKTLAPAIKL